MGQPTNGEGMPTQVPPLLLIPADHIEFQGVIAPDGTPATNLLLVNSVATATISLTDEGLRQMIAQLQGALDSRSAIVTPPQGLIGPNGRKL